MTLKIAKNINYCATVVAIKNIIPLDGCDNIVSTTILGNSVIVGKDVKVGDIGLFFPVECKLSDVYLSHNNLFRHSEKNQDTTKVGYFENNGRIRCVKLRGYNSEGLFMPLMSLKMSSMFDLKLGDQFDELEGVPICEKYVVKVKTPGTPGNGRPKQPKESKIVDNQFRFHIDTAQLYNNLHKIHPDDTISITYKVHGTSFIVSRLLCKKPLKWYEKALRFLGVNIVDTHYDSIYASRKVIKNEDINPNPNHFYNEDIWEVANTELEDYLQDGMTIYGEIVGYLESGGAIQSMGGKAYDYGCCEKGKEHQLYIYRITYTNPSGKVFEFTAKQVQEWCKLNGLTAVPQLYYGSVQDFGEAFELIFADTTYGSNRLRAYAKKDFSPDEFLLKVKAAYTDKDCYLCKNKLPEEGCVVRVEGLGLEVFKCKSPRFLLGETKDLDKGISDLESEN